MKIFEPSEKDVQGAIVDYLVLVGAFWWRQNNGMAVYQDKNRGERRVRYGTEGASDLGAIVGGNKIKKIRGTFVAIEVKKPSEHTFLIKHYDRIKSGDCKTKRDWHLFHQIGFIENVIDHGGVGFFASSVDQVVEEFVSHGLIK